MNNYYENEGLSQSELKRILEHPKVYKNAVQKSSTALSLGSLFDCLLLTPENFKKEYVITPSFNISDKVKLIWDTYYENSKVLGNFEIDEEALDNLSKDLDFRAKQDNVRLKYVLEGKEYYKFLQESENKSFVTPEELEIANNMVNSIKGNKITSEIISKITESQVEIYWEYNGCVLKSLLDFIIKDDEAMTIEPWDLKSTGFSTSNFSKSFYKYRLDIQGSFYTSALKYKFPEYEIKNFKFLVESSKYIGSPLIFEMSDKSLSIGENGGEVDGVYYFGWKDALERVEWHTTNDLWNYTKEQYESNLTIVI